MGFKSKKQQDKVMRSLRIRNLLKQNPNHKHLTFKQLRQKGVFLKFQADSDNDGVVNVKDCRPLDSNKQGIIHDTIKKLQDDKERKRQERIDKERAEIEKLQEEERLRLTKEKLKLQQQEHIQTEKDELKKLREQRRALQKARFESSVFGKATKIAGKGAKIAGKVALKSIDTASDIVFADEKPKRKSKPKAKKKKKKKKKSSDDDWGYIS